MSARVVSTAPSGAVLTVFSQSGSWAKVQYNATVAYANTGFISAVTATYPSGCGIVRQRRGHRQHVGRHAAASTCAPPPPPAPRCSPRFPPARR